jgi:hypothetical protein
MKDLYSSEPRGDRYFDYQDEEGLPVVQVSTTVDGLEYFCTLTRTNKLNRTDWTGKAKDKSFRGTVWSPRKFEHLIRRTDLRERCCGCHGLNSEDDAHWAAEQRPTKRQRTHRYGSVSQLPKNNQTYAAFCMKSSISTQSYQVSQTQFERLSPARAFSVASSLRGPMMNRTMRVRRDEKEHSNDEMHEERKRPEQQRLEGRGKRARAERA